MRKPFIIGDKAYKFKKDAILHYKTILNSYNFGQSLGEEDFFDVIDLLSIEQESPKDSEEDSKDLKIKRSFPYDKNHFSDIQIDALASLHGRYIKCPPSKSQVVSYEKVNQLSKDIRIFKNERYYCITQGDFIFGDFIEAFIENRNMKVYDTPQN